MLGVSKQSLVEAVDHRVYAVSFTELDEMD